MLFTTFFLKVDHRNDYSPLPDPKPLYSQETKVKLFHPINTKTNITIYAAQSNSGCIITHRIYFHLRVYTRGITTVTHLQVRLLTFPMEGA